MRMCLQNYDREEEAGTPTHVVNWVNGVLQGEHDPIVSTTLCNTYTAFVNEFTVCSQRSDLKSGKILVKMCWYKFYVFAIKNRTQIH